MTDLNLTFQTASYLIAALSFAVTCAYYIINLSNTNKARQLQVFMQIYSQFNSRQFWDDYFDFMGEDWATVEEYRERDENQKNSVRHVMVWSTFEGMGVLVAKKLLDISVPYDLFGMLVFQFWDKAKILVEDERRKYTPDYGIWTEYLVTQLRKYHEEHPFSETLKRLSQ